MVDPAMIVEYKYQILVIVLAVLLGQTIFGTTGVLLSGQPLKTAMQCGFSLTQIGEFAFIIASLGVSLKVTSHFLYPIVVAVSVITTFLTPYMIRLAVPAYHRVEKVLPNKWRKILDRYSSGSQTVNHENNWRKLLTAIIRIVAIYSVLCHCGNCPFFPFHHSSVSGKFTFVLGEFGGCSVYNCMYIAIFACYYYEEESFS